MTTHVQVLGKAPFLGGEAGAAAATQRFAVRMLRDLPCPKLATQTCPPGPLHREGILLWGPPRQGRGLDPVTLALLPEEGARKQLHITRAFRITQLWCDFESLPPTRMPRRPRSEHQDGTRYSYTANLCLSQIKRSLNKYQQRGFREEPSL